MTAPDVAPDAEDGRPGIDRGGSPIVLSVEQLTVDVARAQDHDTVVSDVAFDVRAGECLGLVGESGSGKSLTLKAIAGLLPHAVTSTGVCRLRIPGDSALREYDPDRVRGSGIAMVFQEPMSALNPTMRIADLIAAGPRATRGLTKAEGRDLATELMREVGIPDPGRRARAYPHELSGGLRQRVMIAMALSGDPAVLLCDEPTTALDVTIQDQILGLLQRERERRGLAVVFVTHDLGVIGQIADRVAVMYSGQLVETGPLDDVFRSPDHPYTLGLLRSIPSAAQRTAVLQSIPGQQPEPGSTPAGCRFAPRCDMARAECAASPIALISTAPARASRCLFHAELDGVIGVADR